MRRKIALFLVAMLMVSAFGADGLRACRVEKRGVLSAKDMLSYPDAGEFFTGSLPQEESQSVREFSTNWQSIVVLRPGRLIGTGNGIKMMQLYSFFPESLRKATYYRSHSIEQGRAPAAHDTEIIVCYIHNQDGAKG